MTVVRLSDGILQRFWRLSDDAGAPLASTLRRDLDAVEITATLAPLGVKVPEELRTLWMHGAPVGAGSVTPDFELLDPAAAVEETRLRQEQSEPGQMQPSWLVFATLNSWAFLFVDCAQQADVSPISFFYDTGPVRAAPSLGALFEYWSNAIEDGAFLFDQEHGRWVPRDPYDHEEVPPDAFWR